MKPEVAIYLNKVRENFSTFPETRAYMFENVSEDEFFEKLEEISSYKQDTYGTPELTAEEFELIRLNMFEDEYIFFDPTRNEPKIKVNFYREQGTFVDCGDYGFVSMN